MRILALEPYYGGSHKAFLDGWIRHSRHKWTVRGLPPRKWKWRMRHAAITFADQVDGDWDLLFCSSMLNLAEFVGLAPKVRDLPKVVYFHENQLTYPVRREDERDYHYVFTNVTTALAADRVWFNTAWHRDSFLERLEPFLKRMPDYQPLEAVTRIREKSEVRPQGIHPFPERPKRSGPLRILWAHRWEHDKNPDEFFEALEELDRDFRLNVVGEQFRESPDAFRFAKEQFEDHIDRWGYQESRAEYEAALLESDVAVSTANHEFFGVGMMEAVAAGAFPCVPDRLAYPEVWKKKENPDFFYDGTVKGLIERLSSFTTDPWNGKPERGQRIVEPYLWPTLARLLDDAVEPQP